MVAQPWSHNAMMAQRPHMRVASSSLALVVLAALARAQAPGVPQGGAACATALDCSLGGECNASAVCACDAWWTGARCDLLNLAPPVTPEDGLQVPGYYSWGGHALSDGAAPPTYHGFFSFMCRHATLGEWTTKSSIWRAVAPAPQGPFELAEMVAQPWSHNAMISETNDAAHPYALYQIGDAVTDPSEWQPCYNASESTPSFAEAPAQLSLPATRAPPRSGDANSVYVRTAPSLLGPWTSLNDNDTAVPFVFPAGGWSSSVNGGNPSPLFFANGTVLMYYSANPCPPDWGNASPGNNCIGVAVGTSWRGPFTAAPLAITHPESEDAFVFRDPRGSFHLLTNVNNDHSRCAQGVPCGGHAWSVDGLTFSNLTIGAFGPVIRFANGSYWRNAYVERPQVMQAKDGTPVAFYVGMGRSSYFDSVSWAQLFCVAGQQGCGPTLPPPPPPPAITQYRRGELCLSTNASFPCPGGWGNSCPVFLASCADSASFWLERTDGSGFIESRLHAGACLNIDCNSCSPHTVVKLIACDSASAFAFDEAAGQLDAASCAGVCVDDGETGAPTPPCKAGEGFLQSQMTLASCASADASGWSRLAAGA
jgi:hypothetical protein